MRPHHDAPFETPPTSGARHERRAPPAEGRPTGRGAGTRPASATRAPGHTRASTAAPELHVIADARATWHVYETDDRVALSEHTNATDAELDALALAEQHGAQRIVIHDRYHRTREALPARAASDPSGIRWTTRPGALEAHESSGELPWWSR